MTKKNLMTKRAKAHIKTGMVTMGGNLALGSIAGVKCMPPAGVASMGTISGVLNLANVGETLRTSQTLPEMLSPAKKRSRKRK